MQDKRSKGTHSTLWGVQLHFRQACAIQGCLGSRTGAMPWLPDAGGARMGSGSPVGDEVEGVLGCGQPRGHCGHPPLLRLL